MPELPQGPTRRAVLAGAVGLPLGAGALSACDSSSASDSRVRLGYFANVTHGVPMTAVARGTFERHLAGPRIETQIFDSGPTAVQALLAGALDVAYVGPNPAITAWVRTKGKGVRLVAGAAENGAALVARPGISSVEDLRGRTVATPQLGGTQDVALKHLLQSKGLKPGASSDEVEVLWMANSQTLDQFKQRRIDATYLAEPWVSRLVLEAGAHVLVDETSLWPEHRFATTSLLVTQDFLDRRPRDVTKLLAAHVEASRWITGNHGAARALLNREIARLTGKKLKRPVIERAMKNVVFGWDPMIRNVAEVAEHTWQTGGIDVKPDLHGMVDVRPLNDALRAAGLRPVSDDGFGVEEGR